MNCPGCAKELTERTWYDLAVDECPSCLGIWFDRGELEAFSRKISQKRNGGPGTTHAVEQATAKFEADEAGESQDCPKCARSALRPGKVGGYALSRCIECHGIYTTRSELDRIRAVGKPGRWREGVDIGADSLEWIDTAFDALGELFHLG